MRTAVVLLIALLLVQCKDQEICCDLPPVDPIPHYFPPKTGDWATMNPDSLQWNTNAINDLYTLLEDNNSRAFLVLQNGKIVLEKYWGKDILNINNFDATKAWYWASAGKTLTGFMVGKAQQEGYLSINDQTNT